MPCWLTNPFSCSVYGIDLGSAYGTFVANERLTKDSPVELGVGQSLCVAASTRVYILKKDNAALFPHPLPSEFNLPSPPDPSDEEAVLAYNTFLIRYGLAKFHVIAKCADFASSAGGRDDGHQTERPVKKIKTRVAFRDQVRGELIEVVGISHGAHVETEPGLVGVKEGGSLVGKYESLVQATIIPKGKETSSARESVSQKGATSKIKLLGGMEYTMTFMVNHCLAKWVHHGHILPSFLVLDKLLQLKMMKGRLRVL